MRRLGSILLLVTTACTSGPPTTDTAAPLPPLPSEAAQIDSVIDGDSVRLMVAGEDRELRLLGINAPEHDECWSAESRDSLAAMAVGGLRVVLAGRDQFGRDLGYLYRGDTNLNREQVATGAAIALAVEHEFLPDLLAAEEEAIALQRGLWGPEACGSTPGNTTMRIWAVEPDAPGRDDQNPNGEFVSLTNDGTTSAHLSGWVLRDESTRHRYVFPDGFRLAAGSIVTIRSGCGDDTDTDLFWCADGTVWTNSGDTVLLLDANGTVIDRARYFED